jgi:hypothetical protein
VTIVAGDTVRTSADRLQVLDPPLTVQWKDVHEIYRSAVQCQNGRSVVCTQCWLLSGEGGFI